MNNTYAHLMEKVAVHLFGSPKKVSSNEWRFGTNDSLSINPIDATWYSHEEKKGGGLYDLITWQTGEQGKRWLEKNGFLYSNDVIEKKADVSELLKQPTEYIYTDEHGEPRYKVKRYYQNGARKFSQSHFKDGRWDKGLGGAEPLPYQLAHLYANLTATVYIVEGEKDADRLIKMGFVATTNSGGAGKWSAKLNKWFKGRDVIIIPDNDEPGQKHGKMVFSELSKVANSVALQDLVKIWPDCPEKGDISDFMDAGCDMKLIGLDSSLELNSKPISALEKLRAMSATNRVNEMKKKMLNDVFVLKHLAILGQWTVFYAAPGTGKTLLTIWLLVEALNEEKVNPSDVFYVNLDDTYSGGVLKAEIAKEYGFNMIINGDEGARPALILELMDALVLEGDAMGKVLILDTLKKFTDTMDKKASSDFGEKIRNFVAVGGTVICLAHTNKRRNSDGKPIPQGTSDIVDDADCAYILDAGNGGELSVGRKSGLNMIEFENIKSRGRVASKAYFEFTINDSLSEEMPKQNYHDLLKTVRRVSQSEVDESHAVMNKHAQLIKDQEVISEIIEVIKSEEINKTYLIKRLVEETVFSKKRIKSVLDRRTGDDYNQGHRWELIIGDNNKHTYFPLKKPWDVQAEILLEHGGQG